MLSTEELLIHYPKNTPLFEPLNLKLEENRLTILLGANGAGKSSILRTLAGIQKPQAGKVCWAGKELAYFSVQELAKKISFVFTHRPHDSYLTVEEVIGLGRFPYMRWYEHPQKKDIHVVDEALALTNLTALRQKRLINLSDGQLQKVMIARALAQDTPVVLLDEPTAHLDLSNRFLIFDLLQNLTKKTKKTFLVATHDLEPALQTADKVWLLHNQKCHIAIPEILVLEGLLGEAFGSEKLYYDTQKDNFQLKKNKIASLNLICSKSISAEKTYKVYNQTQKAFQRVGFEIKSDATPEIHILPTDSGFIWEWVGQEQFSNLEDVLNSLSNYFHENFA